MAQKKKNAPIDARPSGRAVVDIGSNSVRLVIYDGPRRAPIAIFNEKALCGLGRDMTRDGALNPASVADALSTLERFERLLSEYGNPKTHVIATAAVREAKDSAEFIKSVKKAGFDVQLISGAEEARLAALGVVSFNPDANGLAGDMGGGSLELVALKNGAAKSLSSLSIGPLRIMAEVGQDMRAAKAMIEDALNKADWLKPGSFETLYTVGGAWRAVARIHMRLRSYPLSVLHHYELMRHQVLEICDLVAHQSRQSLENIPGIPRRRLDTLPYAALVLQSVIERTDVSSVVVSSGGVREGLLYEDLSKEERKQDPLLAAAQFYADKLAPDSSFGRAAFDVIDPLFGDDDSTAAKLRRAACLLADVGAYFHPDHRARHAFDTALRAPLVGVSHRGRVAIALALYRRHAGRSDSLPDEQAVSLLSWEEQQWAMKLGLALRFVASLSPKVSAPIKGCLLVLKNDQLVFKGPKDRASLMAETPLKRLTALSSAYGVEAVTDFSS